MVSLAVTPLLREDDTTLVPLSPEHKTRFMELANVPEIGRRINKPFPYTDAHFALQLETIQTQTNLLVWMIERSGKLVGVINFAPLRDARIFQGGYWIDPLHWGKGTAPRALRIAKQCLFDRYGAQRVQAVVEPDNTASMRVLEKAGFQKEGLLRKFYSLRGALTDVWMYADTVNQSA